MGREGSRFVALDVETLYTQMAPKLRSYFIGRLPPYDRDLADDLVGDVFVRVCAAADRYEDRDRLSSWVFQIAHNLLRDHIRHVARIEPPCSFDPDIHDRADASADYACVLDRLTLDGWLAATDLTIEQRVALDAYYVRHETWPQASLRTGETEQALKKRHLRALANLRRTAERQAA